MDSIHTLLGKYEVKQNTSTRINTRYETAKEFGQYVGIPVLVVLRLFKLYGVQNTLAIRSWLYDVPHDNRKGGKIALAHWKLKQKK